MKWIYTLKKVKRKFLNRSKSSEEYIFELRKKGCKIGDDTFFYGPANTIVDTIYPYCVEIGNGVSISSGVKILAHDFSYSVLNAVYGIMPQNCSVTSIGDNVFIGMDSIILMGTKIGNNVIIGAGAVVCGNIPDNTVWAGNPARQISTLDEYRVKRMQRYEEGAVNLAKQIITRLHRKPTYDDMRMFIGLFTPRSEENKQYFNNQNKRFDNISESVLNMEQKYESLDEFLKTNKLIF